MPALRVCGHCDRLLIRVIVVGKLRLCRDCAMDVMWSRPIAPFPSSGVLAEPACESPEERPSAPLSAD